MKIDRYTKVVLTIIAVGVIGLNVHFFKDDFVTEAHAHYPIEFHKHGMDDLIQYPLVIKTLIEACKSAGKGEYLECDHAAFSTF